MSSPLPRGLGCHSEPLRGPGCHSEPPQGARNLAVMLRFLVRSLRERPRNDTATVAPRERPRNDTVAAFARGSIIAALILASCAAGLAADFDAIAAQFAAGNQAYTAGDYARARDSYLRAYAAGSTGPNLCYNLGNVYTRMGDAPRAVLWYRRALRLAPRDRDAAANLKRVLTSVPDTIPDVPPTWVHAAGRWLVAHFSLGELAAGGALCWWALVGLIVYQLRIRRLPGRKRLLPWGVGGLLALLLLLTFVRWQRDWGTQRGIVVAQKVTVLSGPGAAFDRVVEAPGGLDVQIVADRGAWLQVQVPTGVIGWVQKSDIEPF